MCPGVLDAYALPFSRGLLGIFQNGGFSTFVKYPEHTRNETSVLPRMRVCAFYNLRCAGIFMAERYDLCLRIKCFIYYFKFLNSVQAKKDGKRPHGGILLSNTCVLL